jgi:hypothetical protein
MIKMLLRDRSADMGKVSVGVTMSLDGFIAGPNDGPERPLGEGGERLFEWYSGGDTEYRLPGTEMVFRVTAPIDLESTRVIEAPGVTHLTFRVVKQEG